MPELAENQPTLRMNPLDHFFPTLNLLRRPNPRRIRITHPHRIYRCRFGQNQSEIAALLVILRHHVVRNTSFRGPATG